MFTEFIFAMMLGDERIDLDKKDDIIIEKEKTLEH